MTEPITELMSDSPARHLNLAGASNFRDLGGYPARDGRAASA
jgi:protein-tyrosine phosphatase